MDKHTDGPWKVAGSGHASAFIPGAEAVRVWGPDRAGVAEILTRKSLGGKGPSDEMMANAHLIAAAPELLAALRALTDACTSSVVDTPIVPSLSAVQWARSAIARAINGNC